jgi:molecular chaperone GrpE
MNYKRLFRKLKNTAKIDNNKKRYNMSKDNEYSENAAAEQDAPEVNTESQQPETEADAAPLSETEQLQAENEKLQAAVEKEKKEYLFLMADFDNYRKRVLREKAEILRNGSEKVLGGLLPIVDDFERGLQATKDAADENPVREGMELIYNKFIKFLEDNGVKAMESTGTAFDSELHEAIATIPAPADDLKGKVIDTTQKGYMINDKVLRHAKVVVGE